MWEERVSECMCGFDIEKETDKSLTLMSVADLRICAACGISTKECLCDFHDMNINTGNCSKCGAFQPGNQICPMSQTSDILVTSTPKINRDGV